MANRVTSSLIRNMFASSVPAMARVNQSGELRSWQVLDNVLSGLSVRSKSGVYATATNTLGYPAAFSCIRLVSETIAVMPVHSFRRTSSSAREYIDHPVKRLLNKRPNPITTAFDIKRDLVAYAMIFPSSYLIIERNPMTAEPVALWGKKPTEVTEYTSSDGKNRVYRVSGYDQLLNEWDVIRITNIFGKSVVQMCNSVFGTAIATEEFAAQYFANNGNVARYASTEKQLQNATQRQNLENDLGSRFSRHGETPVPLLEHGIKVYELNGPSMTNAQALESRKWNAEDVCRIMNVPPSKIGIDAGTRYNSIEMMDTEFMKKSILPWITALEQELEEKLFAEREKIDHYFKFNTAVVLKADIKTRMEAYDKMKNVGFTFNEIRELEDRDPVEGGDKVFIQVNQIPIDKADEYADKLIASGAQPATDNNAKV